MTDCVTKIDFYNVVCSDITTLKINLAAFQEKHNSKSKQNDVQADYTHCKHQIHVIVYVQK